MAANPSKAEAQRLDAANAKTAAWKKWGPYLSERQWGTVREDYSQTGDAWGYFSHDQARSRAYRWGEDGLGGISDDRQQVCFGLALWNGQDAILKERLFGLTNSEGNHGEDVKEYYFYLDSTPTHSYMKFLYKYPQAAFPYMDLVETNRHRSRLEMEYELIDTGIFDEQRYFDVFVEYAKATPEELLIKITVHNRGPEAATLHVLPTLWFRNTWDWFPEPPPKPQIHQVNEQAIAALHPDLGTRYLYGDRPVPALFTENETNRERVFGLPNASPYVKDAFHRYVINGEADAVNPEKTGTKSAFHYVLKIPAGGAEVIRLKLGDRPPESASLEFGSAFDELVQTRITEADEFYAEIIPEFMSDDQQNVMRQAFAGMLWTKQYYYYPVRAWLHDEILPPDCKTRIPLRNHEWFHLESADILSMPDKWEYPWFAAWDLAFHTLVLAAVDMAFAKDQLRLMTHQVYLHPNGQIPAYEWNFSDVNPPVHCTATWQVYLIDKARNHGKGDRPFLEGMFHKLLMNFTWWVNRKDSSGNNVFEGGFLGLDNIGVFDRSAPLPTGGTLEQADGTGWMAMFCLDMLSIALELSTENQVYEELACKFYEHFMYIAGSMDRIGQNDDELWDEDDGFYYDLLRFPNGYATRLKVRSMVGLIPLFASSVFDEGILKKLPVFAAHVARFTQEYAKHLDNLSDPRKLGVAGRHLLSPVSEDKLRRILQRMLDESEFLSNYGIRALSRYHKDHPYIFNVGSTPYRVDYEPAESSTNLFGGNSNWRGPIWMPVNSLISQSLRKMYAYYGDDFKAECPAGSGNWLTLWDIANEIDLRLSRIFLRNEQGERPVYGETSIFQNDPHWRDLILFYEYFHGDNGAGIGASHQTGWTGVVARLMTMPSTKNPQEVLEHGFLTVTLDKEGVA
ncbi:glucosidase [Thermoleptolyngbya sp. C42_A2020_037]|uniref:MGH1-like glycoside hydrolase domain-containing protein n=1 Tax=Thermoleptolyngbya sp. C42_A2020_037 TaxID=2747799 RepID=UPI0019F18BBB|nr:glucosidase [Thermoleptolyngbya sp. C42_A2020_037]MBF2085156.1 glucosidase [Thermoleptolyngbya sp. C42_A2020_037]